MLLDFVNCLPEPESFQRFKLKWDRVSELRWKGNHRHFLWAQRIVQEIWEGRKRGIEGMQVGSSLGLESGDYYAEEGERIGAPAVQVDWRAGQLILVPRNLEDVVWLTLLQHSRELAICGNRTGECPTPYFLKYRPRQKFCSDACALPAQREFKRKWWSAHGKEWKQKQQHKRGEKRPNLF
jgi:hypothetical protein